MAHSFIPLRYEGQRCEFLPPCYKSRCVQRFSYVKLLAVSPSRPHYRWVAGLVACVHCVRHSFFVLHVTSLGSSLYIMNAQLEDLYAYPWSVSDLNYLDCLSTGPSSTSSRCPPHAPASSKNLYVKLESRVYMPSLKVEFICRVYMRGCMSSLYVEFIFRIYMSSLQVEFICRVWKSSLYVEFICEFACRVYMSNLYVELESRVYMPSLKVEFICRVYMLSLYVEFICRVYMSSLKVEFICRVFESTLRAE